MKQLSFQLSWGDVAVPVLTQLAESDQAMDGVLPGMTAGEFILVSLRRLAQPCWEIHLRAQRAWAGDALAQTRVAFSGRRPTHLLAPAYRGVFERWAADQAPEFEYRGPGGSAARLSDAQRLALPLLIVQMGGARDDDYWLIGADPEMAAAFQITFGAEEWQVILNWRYLAAAGVHADEKRRIIVKPCRTLTEALNAWFEWATPDAPPGPAWLHDIALNDYDYFSKNGRGWFADIDAACQMIAPAHRHRAIFCLHGWYDQIGRYCFDPHQRRFDESWTVFPHIHHPDLLKLENRDVVMAGGPIGYAFRNLKQHHPITLDWAGIRERLSYARQRGLRVAFYHATGMQIASDSSAHRSAGARLDHIQTPLWQGPDLIGATCLVNPLHPEVRDWMLAYTQALLERVGDLIDALVLDEAYYIPGGALGPASCPGYADRAQMRLVREIAALCHACRPDIAYLTADHLGTPAMEPRAVPYSLFADGIYHDSWSSPFSWGCAFFPTWRNVTWSCNWAPVSNYANIRWSVLAHDAPIAVSNGCFGDDVGLADMDAPTLQRFVDLWQIKISRRQQRGLTVVDMTRP